MDQDSSNDEKNWGSKISLDCPFKVFKYLILADFSNVADIGQWGGPQRKSSNKQKLIYSIVQ